MRNPDLLRVPTEEAFGQVEAYLAELNAADAIDIMRENLGVDIFQLEDGSVRLDDEFVPDESVDTLISNCFSLLEPREKLSIYSDMIRTDMDFEQDEEGWPTGFLTQFI
jgi:hypothetical protein